MKQQSRRILRIALVVGCSWAGGIGAAPEAKPVKVFILAGQSNMEGKGKLRIIDNQIETDERRAIFGHLKEGGKKDGAWVVRDDVWVVFGNKRGEHTVGFGHEIGPELEFGNVVGDHFDEQVLIIKAAWGGAALARKYRPPSAGDDSVQIAQELERHRKKNPDASEAEIRAQYGSYYQRLLDTVAAETAQLKTHFPGYKGQGVELAGLVWFQGWNDRVGPGKDQYETNLAHLIRDLRRDLKSPDLPVVIGQCGFDGTEMEREKRGKAVKPDPVKAAQAAVAADPAFKGTVALVPTDVFWDWKAQTIFDLPGGWRKNREAWDAVGGDYPYHYLGSPYFHCRAGRAFGEAMLELLDQ